MFRTFSIILKDEFQTKNLSLSQSPSDEFVKSEWQTKPKNNLYLAYRWLIALIFIASITLSLFKNKDVRSLAKWFIYLTDWGITLCFITSTLGAVLVTIWYFRSEISENVQDENKMPLLFKIYWISENITLTTAIVITIIYWSILYDNNIPIDAEAVVLHLTNSIIMFIDLQIVAYPLRLVHVVYTIGFSIIYTLFSLVYYWSGGTNLNCEPYIYDILDWSNIGLATTTTIGTILLAIVIHFLMFIVYKLRSHVSQLQKQKRANLSI